MLISLVRSIFPNWSKDISEQLPEERPVSSVHAAFVSPGWVHNASLPHSGCFCWCWLPTETLSHFCLFCICLVITVVLHKTAAILLEVFEENYQDRQNCCYFAQFWSLEGNKVRRDQYVTITIPFLLTFASPYSVTVAAPQSFPLQSPVDDMGRFTTWNVTLTKTRG